MGSVLISLTPLVVGSILTPTWIILVFVMLGSGDGLVEAVAFVAGVTMVRLLQGVLFGAIVSVYEVAGGTTVPDSFISILLLVTGMLLWAVALKQLSAKEDLQTHVPRWQTFIHALTPAKALAAGALLVVTSSRAWLFTLAAIGVITQATLGPAQSIVAFLLYILGADLLIVAPIVVSMSSSARFEAAALWLQDHNRTMVIAVSFLIGSVFIWRGAVGFFR